MSLWFNTSIKRDEANSLSISGDWRNNDNPSMMFSAEINHLETVSALNIPYSEEMRFFFWQFNQFVNDYAGDQPLLS